ncbi:hypothetical protein E2562_035351 [Oryza meyeriana var. granulata]|uniref:Uncharacterized protein n=1 Tax=Oryza meyeriana var. granulata TaxID=110450 RepID=A0A6G1CWU1_9ORYZ|nr:hypothetical protein E2562_035351 [Oryza meyeriana var. granulata]
MGGVDAMTTDAAVGSRPPPIAAMGEERPAPPVVATAVEERPALEAGPADGTPDGARRESKNTDMAWRAVVEALLAAKLATTSAVPVSISRPAGGWKAARMASTTAAPTESGAA